jgi:hypothetical protein
MRKLFEALSIFDWLTPTIALLEDIAEGGPFSSDVWTFYIPNDKAIGAGWSAAHIENLLGQYGIRTWGGLVHLGEYFFKVKLNQAAWAEHVLDKHGVPINRKARGAPRSHSTRSSPFDAVFQSPPEPLRCEYCRSFDIRKSKCHNCGGMT